MKSPTVIVVGARSARQGIGEYVAAAFARHGACVTGIVGTSVPTVDLAQQALARRHAIHCRGYTSIEEAFAHEPAGIAAICSPYVFHAEHLAAVGCAGLHCLCEKPLYCPRAAIDCAALTMPFVNTGRLLAVLTQWPCTLPAFYALHPEQAGATVDSFEMRLSPISSGYDMAPDAVPHFLSMVRALVGSASLDDMVATFIDGDPHHLRLEADVVHPRARMSAVLHLETCPERPRPAWYAINGNRVDREIELPAYRQFFRSENRRVPLDNPLDHLVAGFLDAVANGRATDHTALEHDQNLLRLVCGAVWAQRPSTQKT